MPALTPGLLQLPPTTDGSFGDTIPTTQALLSGGASGLVTCADFKSVGRVRKNASVGFDSHTPPPNILCGGQD